MQVECMHSKHEPKPLAGVHLAQLLGVGEVENVTGQTASKIYGDWAGIYGDLECPSLPVVSARVAA